MTTGTFNVSSSNVVTTSSPVEVGVAPAQGATFTPLLLLQSGVQFTSTNASGTFSTPADGGTGGAVSAYEGSTTVPLLDAHSHTFEAPALLSSSSYDLLSSSDMNGPDLPVAGGDLSVTALQFDGSQLNVQGNLTFPNFPGLSLPVQGSDSVAVSSTGAPLTGLDVTLPGTTSFSEAGLQLTATNLQVSYAPSNNQFDLSGSATLAAAGNTLSLTLGSPSSPGLVIQGGDLDTLDATVSGSFAIGGATLTAQDLTIQASGQSDLTVTGTATFGLEVGSTTETVDLSLNSTPAGTATQGGLVIDPSTGDLVSLDAAVTSDITIAGMDITTSSLAIDYVDSTSSGGSSSGDFLAISGDASISVDGSSLSINLPTSTPGSPAGLVIEDGQLSSLDATINSNISVAGITVDVMNLNVDYSSSNDDLEISGAASITVPGQSPMDVMLGNTTTPGIQMTGGQVTSLDASFAGDITIGGMSVTATGLTVDYSSTGNGSIDVYGAGLDHTAGK